MSYFTFHPRTGSMVLLSNENRTALRHHPYQEFNNGLVMSNEPLKDNQLFEVRIDRKVPTWSGSIEIGVTSLDPNALDFPSSATNLRESSWVMSGTSVLQDGRSLVEEYGEDLDKLGEGDRVGVMRTSNGELHFFVNGIDQGIAAGNINPRVYAVVDMYGKCAQVSVLSSREAHILANERSNENIAAAYAQGNLNSDKLKFHERCGSMIKLSNSNRTAERKRPVDEFNNGVVMTHRPLIDNELFEIQIDELVNKWSGSIEMGITTHNPDNLDFPATMTNMRSVFNHSSGTIMMSGCGILINGKGSRREYGEFNLDELHEGDRIGLIRKSNGNLHYYINGLDQGIAADNVPAVVHGVVDLYGMTVKVTIVDSDASSPDQSNDSVSVVETLNECATDGLTADPNKLTFHTKCGEHAAVINNGRTAHRPNALEDFNNAVILTSRPLKKGEMFEVVIEKLVVKWAGSIEIGVTTHSPNELEFPSTMTNIRSGTWMMTGNGIMYNGTNIIDDYGHNLDRLKVGDRVGVLRTATGTLHFFVDGIDQGPAATNIPEKVYGVIDLYGQAAQASIVYHSESNSSSTTPPMSCEGSTSVTMGSDLKFHHLHGRNARILNNGLTAKRPNAQGEFNDAIVVSNRPLREGEMFEVIVEEIVDRWSGSIEAGVTTIPPEELDFPSTMTDIDHDTWMLSGCVVMQDGMTIQHSYKCDLDQLTAGTTMGMMRHSDGTLHYYINGEDQGTACSNIPPDVYAVIDLYGQCAQVSLNHCLPSSPFLPASPQVSDPVALGNESSQHFNNYCGKNITLRNNNTIACRIRGYNNGLVFSSSFLEVDELFEMQIDQLNNQWAGSILIGLTTFSPANCNNQLSLPSTVSELQSCDTWFYVGTQIKRNGVLIKDNYGPSLERLVIGDRIGIRYGSDNNMHIHLNSEDLGVAATNLPKKLYAILDLYGTIEIVKLCNTPVTNILESQLPPMPIITENEALEIEEPHSISKEHVKQEFHENRGKNIQLLHGNLTAKRIASYNQGIVVSSKPLPRDQLFQVRIDKLHTKWTSSLQIGIIAVSPEKLHFPVSAFSLRKSSWIICGDSVFQNSIKVKGRYGPNLDSLQTGHVIGIMIDTENRLHLFVNNIDQGIAARNIPAICYALVDVYGQCEQVSIIEEEENESDTLERNHREKNDIDCGSLNELRDKQLELPLYLSGIKEKINKSDRVKNCEYHNACSRFKSVLGLPEGFFLSDQSTCYCETCHKIRGDELYFKRGEPPKEYALPFGWCRFALKLNPKIESNNMREKWHVAFHGTKVGAVRQILDHGQLISPGEMGLGPFAKEMVRRVKGKDLDLHQVFLSPTLQYAGNNLFSPQYEFIEPKTRKVVYAKAAFQVYVRPGSYTVGPQRLGAREPIDTHFSNGDLEWRTKECGATILHSLLIRLEGFGS
ncbi:neuralized-like protein 4 isoform X1 [Centruroides sculpturatus]|uniref:neuralized-like protein 4 isoform X1 n=1 Tax=Centruroides sculpturatus TaxID=218467 RepID=UPI000C6D03F0|nr:neuralized-like protein 4 isoform X1 [Centruroides sculpturatus]